MTITEANEEIKTHKVSLANMVNEMRRLLSEGKCIKAISRRIKRARQAVKQAEAELGQDEIDFEAVQHAFNYIKVVTGNY